MRHGTSDIRARAITAARAGQSVGIYVAKISTAAMFRSALRKALTPMQMKLVTITTVVEKG